MLLPIKFHVWSLSRQDFFLVRVYVLYVLNKLQAGSISAEATYWTMLQVAVIWALVLSVVCAILIDFVLKLPQSIYRLCCYTFQ